MSSDRVSRLVFGSIDFDELIRTYGSPLYVYDFSILRDQVKRLRKTLPAHVDIYYAVKSNPNPAILSELVKLNCGCDVASLGEIQAAIRAGQSPDRILFTGPGKTEHEIRSALMLGVDRFNAESETEIRRIDAAAHEKGVKARIGLRINTDYAIAETRSIIGGRDAKKFGVDETLAADLILRCRSLANVEFQGLHVFNATQILDYRELVANTANILRLAIDMAEKTGIRLTYVDVGGGLGIPYAPEEHELDVEALGRSFTEIYKQYDHPALRDVRWIVEPGRYISGPCGFFLCRITDIKASRGVKFLITDGGIQNFVRPALVGQSHPVRLAANLDGDPNVDYRIEGPLCTSLDVLSTGVRLPEAAVGDVLVYAQAGAYGYTESMPLFLSHPWPAEVAVDADRIRLIRKRIEPTQFLDMTLP